MSEVALLAVGFLFGLVAALLLAQRHVRKVAQLLDELLEDEIVAPLRKADAPRSHRFQSLYRELLRRLEQFI